MPNPPGKEKVAACGDYAANRGWSTSENSCCDIFDPKKSGPFSLATAANQKLRLVTVADIRDGLSNTIAVGDKWVSDNVTDISVFCGDNPWFLQRGSERGFPTGPNDSSVEKFGSPTGGTAAFVFLDGHVVPISYSIALDVFKALSAVGDGNVISGGDY